MKRKIFVFATIIIASAGVGVAADAAATWAQNCAVLPWQRWQRKHHDGQKTGRERLSDAKVQAAFSDAEAARAIKEGVKTNGKETMKPFASKLSDADIKALVAYVRSFKK